MCATSYRMTTQVFEDFAKTLQKMQSSGGDVPIPLPPSNSPLIDIGEGVCIIEYAHFIVIFMGVNFVKLMRLPSAIVSVILRVHDRMLVHVYTV